MKAKWMAWVLAAYTPLALAQEVVIFGDSLSDVGQQGWALKATYLQAGGKPHDLYGEHIAHAWGADARASSHGGHNYAYSGGVVDAQNASTAAQPNLALAQQIAHYRQAGVKTGALHILWGGGNDLARILTRAQAVDPAQATAVVLADINSAAQASAQQWGALKQTGVDLVVMPNVPNVAHTPLLFQQFGLGAAAKLKDMIPGPHGDAASQAFAAAFQAASAQLDSGAQTSKADFDQARHQVLANASAAFYATPFGAALTGNGVDQATFLALLQEEYRKTTASAAMASSQFNTATTTAVKRVGGNVVRLDVDTLFNDILAQPVQYGFANTTGTACSGSVAQTLCTPADAAAADKMLFADGFHPGPKAHKIMADYLLGTLQAPLEMAGLRQLGLQTGEAAADFVREDSNRQRQQRQSRSLDAVAAYQHQAGGDGGHIVHAGVKAQLNAAWQLGAVLSRQERDQGFGDTRIQAKTNSLTTTLRHDAPQWWLGGMLQINDSDYDTRRHIRLGEARLMQSGQTGGSSLGAGVFGGYEWAWGSQTQLALLGDVTVLKGKIKGFAERDGGATQMQFDTQDYTALRSGVGVQLAHKLGAWQPYVNTRWVKDWKNHADPVTAGINGSHFSLVAPRNDRSWVNAQVGVQWQPQASPWRAFAQVGRDLGREGGGTALQLGVGARF